MLSRFVRAQGAIRAYSLVYVLIIWSAVRFTIIRVKILVSLRWLMSAELAVLSVLLIALPLQREGACTLLEVVVSALENILLSFS